jgi:hypothetical protein
MRRQWITTARAYAGVSILLFALSLTQRGFYTDRDAGDGWQPSIAILLTGCLGVCTGIPAWLANPAVIASWILMQNRTKRRMAVICAAGSILIALTFLMQKKILVDEAGNDATITGYGLGYWMWIASMAVSLIGCIAMVMRDRASQA